jgi:beta-galactosidase
VATGLGFGAYRPYADNLWAIGEQAGHIGSPTVRYPAAAPGELTVNALQAIGHGCNLIAWFRFRNFPAADGVNGGGLLPPWGDDGRYYNELRTTIATLAPHGDTIAATRPLVSVARLAGFDQQLSVRVEPWIEHHIGTCTSGRYALHTLGLNEDQLRPADLRPDDDYEVALLPIATALSDDDVDALDAWVSNGGILIVGPLAGHRDQQLHAPRDQQPPGPLSRLTGTHCGESTTTDEAMRILATDGSHVIEASRYAEIVEPIAADTEIIARHSSGWLATHGAVAERSHGAGRVIHCGVALTDSILEWLWIERTLPRRRHALATHERCAETLTRSGDGYRLHFALNHGPGPAVFYLYHEVSDLLSGDTVINSFTVPGYGFRILREELE